MTAQNVEKNVAKKCRKKCRSCRGNFQLFQHLQSLNLISVNGSFHRELAHKFGAALFRALCLVFELQISELQKKEHPTGMLTF
jgi:hypothetical protein